ncbi:MAG: 50S ribosomal protein L23 [bacterium]|nr:50S ribosomal protein L23 [bacterium]
MALFGKTKKVEVKKAAAEAAAAQKNSFPREAMDYSHVLLHPRITEKATMHGAMGVYTFDVAGTANKNQIAQAVSALYKVTPRMVRVVRVPEKRKRNSRTGKMGVKQGGKKAYVYLNKGDSITMNQGV